MKADILERLFTMAVSSESRAEFLVTFSSRSGLTTFATAFQTRANASFLLYTDAARSVTSGMRTTQHSRILNAIAKAEPEILQAKDWTEASVVECVGGTMRVTAYESLSRSTAVTPSRSTSCALYPRLIGPSGASANAMSRHAT